MNIPETVILFSMVMEESTAAAIHTQINGGEKKRQKAVVLVRKL